MSHWCDRCVRHPEGLVGHGWLVEWVVRKTPTKTGVHFIGEPTKSQLQTCWYPVDKTQLLLQLQFWVQHGWTNRLWVPISHYNGLIFFPFKQTTFSHPVLWENPWFFHEKSSIHGEKSQFATVTCIFWWDETTVYGRFKPIVGYSWHIVDYGFCWWYIELVHGLKNQQT